MTLRPWMVFFDRNGRIITTMPMKDAIRWKTAMLYGKVVIRRYLEQPETPEKTVLWTYKRLIDRTALDITDMSNLEIPMN